MNAIRNVSIGEAVMLEWNREPVQVVNQSPCRTTIRSLTEQGGERDISSACEVLPYEGKGLLGGVCACGCGRIVTGQRLTRKYATNACRIRVSKRNGRGNGKRGHKTPKGNGNSTDSVIDFIEDFRALKRGHGLLH